MPNVYRLQDVFSYLVEGYCPELFLGDTREGRREARNALFEAGCPVADDVDTAEELLAAARAAGAERGFDPERGEYDHTLHAAHAAVQRGIEALLDGDLDRALVHACREAACCTRLGEALSVSYVGTHGPDADRARDAFALHVEVWNRRFPGA